MLGLNIDAVRCVLSTVMLLMLRVMSAQIVHGRCASALFFYPCPVAYAVQSLQQGLLRSAQCVTPM